MTKLRYSNIQFSGLQTEHWVSPPIPQLCQEIDGWLDSFMASKPYTVTYDDRTRTLDVQVK